MKPILFTFLAAASAVALLPAQNLKQREQRQQTRIIQGARNGQLTPAETARLEREQARIRQQIRHDRADGGGLTPAERARAERRLDKSSRDIYRLKHNGQTR